MKSSKEWRLVVRDCPTHGISLSLRQWSICTLDSSILSSVFVLSSQLLTTWSERTQYYLIWIFWLFSYFTVCKIWVKQNKTNQGNSERTLLYSLPYWIGFPLLNYLKWSLLLTLIGLLIGKCLVLFLRYLLFWC